jgi:hypothetical protein
MKRDLELVRQILFTMENMDMGLINGARSLRIDGYSENQIHYHLGLMVQAGLLHADTRLVENKGGLSTTSQITSTRSEILSYSISWNGHEFLAAIRDETRWKKTKDVITKVGGLATDVAFDILKEMGKQAAVKLLLP